jgi:aspartate carbamoyltransferase catalytic subunit
MYNEDGTVCAGPMSAPIVDPVSISFSLQTQNVCSGFVTKMIIVDEKDMVLDEKMVRVQKERLPEQISYVNHILSLAALIILTSAILRRKNMGYFSS